MQKEGHPFTKKQLGIIFKIAFLEAMALSLVIPSIQSVGEVPNNPGCIFNTFTKTGCQAGSVLITIPPCGLTPNCIANSAAATVTYSAFAGLPRIEVFTKVNILGVDERSWLVFGAGPQTGGTWTSQPAAETELFGNNLHEWTMLWGSNSNMTCSIIADVIAPGSVNAVLRLQNSPDGSTWSDAQPIPQGDVPIATTGIQTNEWSAAGNGALGLNNNNLLNPFFRIVGLNGNGIASPTFGNIYFECWWNGLIVSSNFDETSLTTTSVILRATILMPSDGVQVDVGWRAEFP